MSGGSGQPAPCGGCNFRPSVVVWRGGAGGRRLQAPLGRPAPLRQGLVRSLSPGPGRRRRRAARRRRAEIGQQTPTRSANRQDQINTGSAAADLSCGAETPSALAAGRRRSCWLLAPPRLLHRLLWDTTAAAGGAHRLRNHEYVLLTE